MTTPAIRLSSVSALWGCPRVVALSALVVVALGVVGPSAVAQSNAAQPASPPAPKGPVGSTTPAPSVEAPSVEDEDLTEDRETELVLHDRRRITGKIVSVTNESVVLSIAGVPTTFKLDTIAAIRELPTVSQRYRELRAAISDDNTEDLLRLAEWLRSRNRFALALKEVDGILAREPAHKGATDLKLLIVQQQKLEEQAAKRRLEQLKQDQQRALEAVQKEAAAPKGGKPSTKPETTKPDTTKPGPSAPPTAPEVAPAQTLADEPKFSPEVERAVQKARDDFPLLTDEQINLIRVFEVNLGDPPAMVIRRDTAKRFLEKYEGTIVEGRGTVPVSPEAREQFFRLRPVQMLSWFFDLRAREFYPEVQVLENPRTMRLFRDTVHRTWLINSCATTKCHGGEEAGRLYLYNKSSASDRAAFTNWVILDQFRSKDGLALIDQRDPARSPLLQMGLPRDRAVIKHPEVDGMGRRWVPTFDDQNDRRFRQAIEWIQSLYPNRTGYPIEYTPPVPEGLAGNAGGTDAQSVPPPR
jgi:hypothetical protein